MRKLENGVLMEMTAEEIAEFKRMLSEHPAPEPTAEERITELEEALALILAGVTE